jgi:hypothetical protein
MFYDMFYRKGNLSPLFLHIRESHTIGRYKGYDHNIPASVNIEFSSVRDVLDIVKLAYDLQSQKSSFLDLLLRQKLVSVSKRITLLKAQSRNSRSV